MSADAYMRVKLIAQYLQRTFSLRDLILSNLTDTPHTITHNKYSHALERKYQFNT